MTPANSDWYQSLKKSPLTPPSWVITIAWTTLYALIIVSAIIFLKNGGTVRSAGFLYYCAAWVLNLLWSPLFFTYQRPDLSFVVVLGLIVLIAYTIIEFYKVSRTAGHLLVPYLVWVIFAAYLNKYIVICNKKYSMTLLPSFVNRDWICKSS